LSRGSAVTGPQWDNRATGEQDVIGITLGDRILLDAFTGRPVPYGGSNGPSPSWS
jgi:hypothetical protein